MIIKKIEEMILADPSLNFSIIVNQALEEWFKKSQQTNISRECFIKDAPKGYGPKC